MGVLAVVGAGHIGLGEAKVDSSGGVGMNGGTKRVGGIGKGSYDGQ